MSEGIVPRRRARLWAALLSFFAPGLGQAFNGEYRRAIGFVIAYAVSTVPQNAIELFPAWSARRLYACFLLALVAGLAVGLASAIDAYRRRGRVVPSLGRWWRYLVYAAVIAAIELPDGLLVAEPDWKAFSIPSASMEPTLDIGDRLIATTDYAEGRAPERGDVAVFKFPADPSTDFVKRVIGLPGDTIQVTDGIVAINGTSVAHDGLGGDFFGETLPNGVRYRVRVTNRGAPVENTTTFAVPPDHYFVMGDNRDDSADSRVANSGVGFVPAENFVARAGFVYFSSDGSASWWEVWKWPGAIRWGRIGVSLEGRG
jgi:signal peptidase I